MYNQSTNLNVSELASGKDGRLYVQVDKKNYFLAEVNEFKVTMTVNTTTYQGAGSIIEGTVPTGVKYALTFTEALIRDNLLMEPILKAISNGEIPVYNFTGKITKPGGGSSQTITYNNAIPSGDFDLQSVTPGEVIKRAQSWALNSIPKFVKSMSATYTYGYSE